MHANFTMVQRIAPAARKKTQNQPLSHQNTAGFALQVILLVNLLFCVDGAVNNLQFT